MAEVAVGDMEAEVEVEVEVVAGTATTVASTRTYPDNAR